MGKSQDDALLSAEQEPGSSDTGAGEEALAPLLAGYEARRHSLPVFMREFKQQLTRRCHRCHFFQSPFAKEPKRRDTCFGYPRTMEKAAVRVEVKNVLATSAGSAVFLGNEEKVFVIYVDHFVGSAINSFLHATPKPRPLTHDLFGDVLQALGGRVSRAVVVDFSDTVYYARLIIEAENEIMERKIVEIDSRPSDAIAMALREEAPIYVADHVWNAVEDMSIVLKKVQETSEEGGFPEF